jgi:hypothetical protein
MAIARTRQLSRRDARASGIPANLALLSTGPGYDINPDLPGMDQFDHAIAQHHVQISAALLSIVSQCPYRDY